MVHLICHNKFRKSVLCWIKPKQMKLQTLNEWFKIGTIMYENKVHEYQIISVNL